MFDHIFSKDPHSQSRRKEYDFLDTSPIGTGGYSEVRLARWHPKTFPPIVEEWLAQQRKWAAQHPGAEHGEKIVPKGDASGKQGLVVAVKVVKKDAVRNNPEYFKILQRGFGKVREHMHVCYCLDWYETSSSYFLSFPYLDGGELLERLNTRGRFTEQATKQIIRVMLDTLGFVHYHGMIHRDIKPDNFLYRHKDSGITDFFLIDFGIAKVLDFEGEEDPKDCFEILGTPGYAAPEVYQRTGYGKNSDVFGVGVIAFNLLSSSSPWRENQYVPLIRETIRCQPVFNDGPFRGVSDEAKKFILTLMDPNGYTRPSARQALAHPWLALDPPVPTPNISRTHTPIQDPHAAASCNPLIRPATMKPDHPLVRQMTVGGLESCVEEYGNGRYEISQKA